MLYKTGEAAALAGVSVRTLRYYDKIGLLSPDGFSENGYRLYSRKNLERLQQILLFKEMDYPLEEIASILKSPNFDKERVLVKQKEILLIRRTRLDDIIKTIDKTLMANKGEREMKDNELFEGLDVEKVLEEQKQYEAEVDARYDSDLVAESRKKTASYSKEKWKEIMEKGAEIALSIGNLMEEGKEIDSQDVQIGIEQYFQYINSHFYTCSKEVFSGLADMYVADERFTQYYEKIKPGLADFFSQAMKHYCG